ncbi:hypothetical protein MRX96_006779 [Rhipicephalus microplus]
MMSLTFSTPPQHRRSPEWSVPTVALSRSSCSACDYHRVQRFRQWHSKWWVQLQASSEIRSPRPVTGRHRCHQSSTAWCFASPSGLLLAVSGAILLSSGQPYQQLQLRIVSACMLASGVVLLAVAVVLIFSWRNRHQSGSVYLGCEDAAAAPPPAYEDAAAAPPPSYESVMMLDHLEKDAEGAGSSDSPHHLQGLGARHR